jgi:hypothetical protein
VSQIRTAFADAEITGWEAREGSYGLPDADDEHVVAAACTAGAGVIVTHNLKDFPADRLPRGIGAVAPSQFARCVVALESRTCVGCHRDDRQTFGATRSRRERVHGPGTSRVALQHG